MQAELPNPVNFEAATAFITEDDMREVLGIGPDGFFDFFERELAEPVRALTPSKLAF